MKKMDEFDDGHGKALKRKKKKKQKERFQRTICLI